MPDSMRERLEQAMADLERTQNAVAHANEELRSASVTVRSKDRSVEATVGPQGELTKLRFLDGKYRTMGAEQLAAAVLEAAGQGRAQMAKKVLDTFQPLSEQAAGDLPQLAGSGIDWERIFGPLEHTASGSASAPRGGSRLRDEIHEDPDPNPAGGGDPGRSSRAESEEGRS